MLTTGMNALALLRFGGFHAFHGGGRGGAGFIWAILAIAVAGLIVWALARAGRDKSANS